MKNINITTADIVNTPSFYTNAIKDYDSNFEWAFERAKELVGISPIRLLCAS